jgi:hypothetical protein
MMPKPKGAKSASRPKGRRGRHERDRRRLDPRLVRGAGGPGRPFAPEPKEVYTLSAGSDVKQFVVGRAVRGKGAA